MSNDYIMQQQEVGLAIYSLHSSLGTLCELSLEKVTRDMLRADVGELKQSYDELVQLLKWLATPTAIADIAEKYEDVSADAA